MLASTTTFLSDPRQLPLRSFQAMIGRISDQRENAAVLGSGTEYYFAASPVSWLLRFCNPNVSVYADEGSPLYHGDAYVGAGTEPGSREAASKERLRVRLSTRAVQNSSQQIAREKITIKNITFLTAG